MEMDKPEKTKYVKLLPVICMSDKIRVSMEQNTLILKLFKVSIIAFVTYYTCMYLNILQYSYLDKDRTVYLLCIAHKTCMKSNSKFG